MDNLRKKLTEFSESIDSINYTDKYSELEELILSFKNIFTKEDVLREFTNVITELELNDYQEEVFWEIGNRLNGTCSEFKRIDW